MRKVMLGKGDRHWITSQAKIAGGVLTDSIAMWGNQIAFPNATLVTLVAAYVPLSVSDGTTAVGDCAVDELECQLFGVPTLPRQPLNNLTQSGFGTLTSAGAITIPAGGVLAGATPVTGTTTGASNLTLIGVDGPLYADHCLCEETQVPVTLTTTWPSWIIAGAVVSVPIVTSGTGTLSGMVFKGDTPNDSLVTLNLYLYKTRVSNGVWRELDITSSGGSNYDYLDHVEDVCVIPANFTVYQSRSWRLTLPFPISLTKGEALVVTLRQASSSGFSFFVPYIRSRVSALA